MRNYLLLAFCLITGLLSAQTVDSMALRRVALPAQTRVDAVFLTKTIDSLILVSRTFTNKSDFVSAMATNALAEKITLEKLGTETAAYASICYNYGRIRFFKQEFNEARPWYERSRQIREKTVGKDNADYAWSLNGLGIVEYSLGNYEKAVPIFLEAKEIRARVLGRTHSDYAANLNNLSLVYTGMRDFEKSEPLLIEANALREQIYGKTHPEHAASLNNLGALYLQTGNYEKAAAVFILANEIRLQTLGKNHPDYAQSLDNLGIAYYRQGKYTQAEPLYLEAKDIRAGIYGKENAQYAASLTNLGSLYWAMRQTDKAAQFYTESKALMLKTLGHDHPDYATCLNDLGIIYLEKNQKEQAKILLTESLSIREKVMGRYNKEYTECLGNLAYLYWSNGESEKALPLINEVAEIVQAQLAKATRYSSESELSAFAAVLSVEMDRAFTAAQRYPEFAFVCYNLALFNKGFLLNTAVKMRHVAATDTAAFQFFTALKLHHRQLAAQYAKPIQERIGIAALEAKTNQLEKEISQVIAKYGVSTEKTTWQEVRRILSPVEAAIEFVPYRYHTNRSNDSIRYAALVLRSDSQIPQFIPLFEEKQLTALLKTEGVPQPTFYNDLYTAGKKGDQLYDLIWKPIATALPQGTTIYCSPSGLLHRINLGAIPTPDGKTLAEKHRLSTLGSTRQLVIPPVPTTQQSATAQLYGGIQYDATPTMAANTPAKPEALAAQRGPVFTQNDSTLRGENWNYLRWTEVEISAAANILKSKGITPTLKKGTEATEESFKALGEGSASPRILHLATHGFFFPDPKESKPNEGQAIGEKTFKVSDNPMIRSGLVLAGGNHAWKTGKPLRPGLEDGILTAYEISQMNLANTELVVLSACETGLGDLVGNEGVYGLQRAFKIAGAKYLIMSLWQVPDFQTQVFMTAFYKHWLERRMAVPEAFRATQAELRGKYSGEAFKWAGFVLVE